MKTIKEIKGVKISLRIPEKDRDDIQAQARILNVSMSEVIRRVWLARK